MCDPVSAGLIISSVIGAGTSLYSGHRARGEAREAAGVQAAQAERIRRESAPITPRRPRPLGSGQGGYASTLLTGPAGVAPGSQNIGANTLLGQ